MNGIRFCRMSARFSVLGMLGLTLLFAACGQRGVAPEEPETAGDRQTNDEQAISSEEGVITGKGEVKETTILFSDIEGFTSISETLTPEQLIEALNQYFSLIAQPIEKYGGVISQFQGDAILATFNAPKPNTYHAKNAVLAAIDIQKSLKNMVFGSNIPFNTRIGINSGHVVGGLVGASGTRVSYTVHGADVNLAARLEQLNKEYGTRVIISEKTYDLIHGQHLNTL